MECNQYTKEYSCEDNDDLDIVINEDSGACVDDLGDLDPETDVPTVEPTAEPSAEPTEEPTML